MRSARYLLAVVAACVFTAPAPARAITGPSQPPLPPEMPRIVAAVCPGAEYAAGCYAWDEATLYDHGLSRYGRDHELGHAYDAQVLDDAERASFAQRVGRPHHAWDTTYTADGLQDVIGLDEIFADAYASCRLGWLPRGPHGRYAWTYSNVYDYEPRTNVQQRRMCAAITRWGLRTPTPAPTASGPRTLNSSPRSSGSAS